MTNFQLCLVLATICSTVGSTAWWVDGSINQVRADMTQSINKVENGLAEVRDGLTEVRVDMTQSFGEVRGDIRVLGTRVDDLASDVQGLQTDVKGLKTDVQGLKTDVKGLKTDVKGLKTDMKDLQTDVQDLQTDVKGKVKVNSLEDDMRDNNEYLRERKIQSVPNDASVNDASMSETPIPKEDPVKLRKISAENKP